MPLYNKNDFYVGGAFLTFLSLCSLISVRMNSTHEYIHKDSFNRFPGHRLKDQGGNESLEYEGALFIFSQPFKSLLSLKFSVMSLTLDFVRFHFECLGLHFGILGLHLCATVVQCCFTRDANLSDFSFWLLHSAVLYFALLHC